MNKMNKVLSLLIMLIASVSTACANDPSRASEIPAITATQSASVKATVETINHKTREVTLRKVDDTIVSFVASDDARNLDQVAVGDIVVATSTISLNIKVVSTEDGKADIKDATAGARTKKGEMPGIAVAHVIEMTATVEEINIEANTFKLKGPKGNVNEYSARNPENLKKAKVGDLVVFTRTEIVSLVVEKQK